MFSCYCDDQFLIITTEAVDMRLAQGNNEQQLGDTVLGPLLFLAFINDLPDAVSHSDPHLFADDCLIYRLVKTDDDARRLQEDLHVDALEEWETKWQTKFHPEKCQVIRININMKRFERHPPTGSTDTHWKWKTVESISVYT